MGKDRAGDGALMVLFFSGVILLGIIVGFGLGAAVASHVDPKGFSCADRDIPSGQCQTWERDQ